MEFVVGSQCWQSAHTDTIGKKDLRGAINPSGAFFQLVPVNMDVVLEALHGTLKGQSPGKQDEHDKIGEESSEPDNLKIK